MFVMPLLTRMIVAHNDICANKCRDVQSTAYRQRLTYFFAHRRAGIVRRQLDVLDLRSLYPIVMTGRRSVLWNAGAEARRAFGIGVSAPLWRSVLSPGGMRTC